MRGKVGALLVCMALWCACLSSCSFSKVEEVVPKAGDRITPTDYSLDTNWAMCPEPVKPVDIFVLYPTTYIPSPQGSIVASIDDEGMRRGAQYFFAANASAFETAGNLYAPYYRQLDAQWVLAQGEQLALYTAGVPGTDVVAAFDYYIQHYNDGRPFMIVGHSQGSAVAKEIVFGYLKDNPEICERLVAAYLIGYAVTQDELDANPHIPFAQSAKDTGVLISYNTVSPDYEDGLPTVLPGAVSINPISWNRDETPAPATNNLGSYLNTGAGFQKVMGLADAVLDNEKGLVICSTAEVAVYGMPEAARKVFPQTSFHNYDISFYYYNLRQNAELRAERFLEAQE